MNITEKFLLSLNFIFEGDNNDCDGRLEYSKKDLYLIENWEDLTWIDDTTGKVFYNQIEIINYLSNVK